MKSCRRCFIEKDLSEFYKHKQMFDGHLNICKECKKKESIVHRENNLEKVREYDRERGKLPHRRRKSTLTTSRRRKQNALYYKAHTIVGNYLRDGKIKKSKECFWCKCSDSKLEGHHHDYSKPLDLTWLCSPCHKKLHLGKSGEAEKMREKIGIPN